MYIVPLFYDRALLIKILNYIAAAKKVIMQMYYCLFLHYQMGPPIFCIINVIHLLKKNTDDCNRIITIDRFLIHSFTVYGDQYN